MSRADSDDTSWRTLHHETSHHGWDNSIPPALSIEPGTTVELDVADASGGQLVRESVASDVPSLDFARVNPVTGPIAVVGAEPGDALIIDILELAPSGWGWTGIIPGFGLLATDFKTPYLHHSTYDTNQVAFTPEIALPTRPFPGTIGVAPAAAGLHSVVPPRVVGGNMDMRDLIAGARLYLPVEVSGALLSVGDTHAAQGQGEVCGTAIETPMSVRIRVGLAKRAGIQRPRFEVPPEPAPARGRDGYHVTTGIGPDLMAAARDAVRDMIDLLGRDYRLEPELAYCLCSVAVDLTLGEVVNAPNWLVSAYLPKSIFARR